MSPIPQEMNPQRDFSAGEFDADAKRRDDTPVMRAAARQLSNWRIRNSGAADNRPGRVALLSGLDRVDEVSVVPGVVVRLCFSNAQVQVLDLTGNVLLTLAASWTSATVAEIVWVPTIRDSRTRDIVVTYRNFQPKILRYSVGTGAWTGLNFTFGVAADGSITAPFARLAAAGVTLSPTAVTGSITIGSSAPYFEPAMIGNTIRWFERQILLTGYTGSQNMQGTVVQTLPLTQRVALSSFVGTFNVGDIVEIKETGNKAEVSAFNGGTPSVDVTYLIAGFTFGGSGLNLIGPSGTGVTTGTFNLSPAFSTQWDEQVFGDFRGWPASCFYDQARLGFCDLPSLPGGVAWSGIALLDNFFIGATPADPMLELAPESCRVYHVMNKSDELVFTDKGIFYIPISPTNPLKPGSVQFLKIAADAAAQVRPADTNEALVFVSAGRNRVVALAPTGSLTSRPWTLIESSLYHAHLFNGVVSIAAATGDGTLTERYVYVVNADGTVAVGKLNVAEQWTGWLPWSGAGLVKWISARGGAVVLSSVYSGSKITEQLDSTQYVDAALLVNNVPGTFTPPSGKGPFSWLVNNTVDLIDGMRYLGVYATDADGFIVPNTQGEDLTSPTLTGGKGWTAICEPFVPNAQGGQDQQQRMRRRRISEVAVTVQNSTGFRFDKIYSGPPGVNLPIQGTTVTAARIAPYNQDDDGNNQPWRREQTYTFRPTGRSYDPRVAIVKDFPGPITINEIGMEVGV